MKVDFKIYNLVYFRISDGRKFYVRRASSTDYVLIDSVSFEKINRTTGYLRKEFVSDKDAALNVKKENGIKVSA